MATAKWSDQSRTMVLYYDEDRSKVSLLPDDPLLVGLTIEDPDPSLRRAEWGNAEKTIVLYIDDEGGRFAIDPSDVRLNDLVVQDMTFDERMVPVPRTVSRFQAQYVMRATTLPNGKSMLTEVREMLEGLAAQVSSLPESDPLRREVDLNLLAFNSAGTFERDSDMIRQIAAHLQLDGNQIDRLFIAAGNVAR